MENSWTIPDCVLGIIQDMCLNCVTAASRGWCLNDVLVAARVFRVGTTRLLAMNGEPPARCGPTELERSLGAMWFHACVLATLREFPNEFTVAGSFALSRAKQGPFPFDTDVDCFEIGRVENRTFEERYAWLQRLTVMMGHPSTMNELENVYEIHSLRGSHYEEEDESEGINMLKKKRISDRWCLYIPVLGFEYYTGVVDVVRISDAFDPTPSSVVLGFDMRMLCVYVDPQTGSAVEAMSGALEDIEQKRIVLLPRAWKDTENGDRVHACPSRISKYQDRGFQLAE